MHSIKWKRKKSNLRVRKVLYRQSSIDLKTLLLYSPQLLDLNRTPYEAIGLYLTQLLRKAQLQGPPE